MVPRPYTIVVEGELGPRYAPLFPGMTLHTHDGRTDISGVVTDQAQLRGILDALAAYNLTLVSVVPGNGGDEPSPPSAGETPATRWEPPSEPCPSSERSPG